MNNTEFTWLETYKEISEWLKTHENKQKDIIFILKELGFYRLKDRIEKNEEIDLEEIDPFTFFCYLNKDKDENTRLQRLKHLHHLLGLSCAPPKDVNGIPNVHLRKLKLFPYKYLRKKDDIKKLWKLFKEVTNNYIGQELFNEVLEIKGVGKNKLTICFFYANPEFYIPLNALTINYIKRKKLKYTFTTSREYNELCYNIKNKLKQLPYQIVYDGLTLGEIRINSIEKFLETLYEFNDDDYKTNACFYYRGHASAKYELLPSIFRNNHILQEDKFYRELISRCPEDFNSCESTFEKLVKMQHYSLPTRLLDITSNPLVALYFACKSNTDEIQENGKLYRFELNEKEIKFFDSDSISIVANISRCPNDFSVLNEKRILASEEWDYSYSLESWEKSKKYFNNQEQVQNLTNYIRGEKPYFLPNIRLNDMERVFCVRPKLDNPRIIRQEGAFFIYGIENNKANPAKSDFNYETFIIPKSSKQKILKQLDVLGINESTLFPDIEHVASHIKNK